MISLQLMKSTVSPPFGSRLIKLSSDLDSDRRIYGRRDLRLQRRMKRVRVSCKIQEGGSQNDGEEPPESLFMKELRRRGITPSSILEESKKSRLEEGMAEKGGEQSFSKRNAVMTSSDKSLTNQREQSMALNSEGLEGLVPRAKLLLTLGGTFFLGFWPLILVTVASFAALYLYFGTDFVHDGTDTPAIPTPYVDPYELLQDERISETAPRVN